MAVQVSDTVTWTDILQGVGTAGALIFSVLVAFFASRDARAARAELQRQRKFASAGLVSAWVEVGYKPSPQGDAYERTATLHIANGAQEPVFQVTVLVSMGSPPQTLGPLAAPDVIPTLPPGRSFSWDISVALRAREDAADPRAEVSFRDAHQREWVRELDGRLVERTGEPVGLIPSPDADRAMAQVGPSIPTNPMAVAIAFILAVVDGNELNDILELVASGSPMEVQLRAGSYDALRDSLADWSIGGQARYPTPRIAYVKVLDPFSTGQVVTGGPHALPARILTLVNWAEDGSWTVYEFGPRVEPDWIVFPPGILS